MADTKQFQINKFARIGLSFLVAAGGALITAALQYDWRSVVPPEYAGIIVAIIGVVKMAYESFAPSADRGTIPTGNSIITHKAVPEAGPYVGS
jgi:hypothetical protein